MLQRLEARAQVVVNTSTSMAVAVVAALRRGGVTDVVLSPGSRSAALAVVLHQADAEGLLRLHVRVDERTAGFLALGLAKGSHRPVAVVTTSGTAVVNLHPAVLEASHAGVRLLVLSADRPAALRGTGANQTTDQVGIFGPHIPTASTWLWTTGGLPPGLWKPRSGQPARPTSTCSSPSRCCRTRCPSTSRRPGRREDGPDPARAASRTADDPVRLERGPRTVVVAGDDAGPPARLMAERANWPLLAEPTSGVPYRLARDPHLPAAARDGRSASASSGWWSPDTRRSPGR